MSDVAIIGSRDMVDIFRILGAEAYYAEKIEEARVHLDKILDESEHKVVFILESLACHMREEMIRAEEYEGVTVVPLPDHKSEINFLDDELKRLSKKAIGMEI